MIMIVSATGTTIRSHSRSYFRCIIEESPPLDREKGEIDPRRASSRRGAQFPRGRRAREFPCRADRDREAVQGLPCAYCARERAVRMETSNEPFDGPDKAMRAGALPLPPGPIDRLNGLQVQRTGRIVVGTGLIGETLANRRKTILFPPNRALCEREDNAADFRCDFAMALDRVERLYGSE